MNYLWYIRNIGKIILEDLYFILKNAESKT